LNKITLAAVFLAAMAPLAHAGLEINYLIDGVAQPTCGPVAGSNPSVVCPSISGPPLTITILGASSNSPGGTPSEETSAVVTLTNTTAASHTLVINVISTGFTMPTAPPTISLLSHIGGSVAVGAAGSLLSYISCVDTGNSQTAGCPAAFNAPTISPSITAVGSFDGDSSSSIASLASPYAVDEKISLTLGANESMNFSASTTLVQTPEPMSIALLGGILLFTTGAIRRKRNQASRG